MKNFLNSTLIGLFLTLPVTVYAVDRVDPGVVKQAKAVVSKLDDGFYVNAHNINNLVVMNVRIHDDAGNQILYTRSFGESVQIAAFDLDDGIYRYQVSVVFELDNLADSSMGGVAEAITRSNGEFRILNGVLYETTEVLDSGQHKYEEASIGDWLIEEGMSIAKLTLEFLVPSVQAQNVTLSSDSPSLFFDDTDSTGSEWVLISSVDAGDVRLVDFLGENAHNVLDIRGSGGSTLNQNAFVIDADGDLHWANGLMNFDKGESSLSIGWQSTAAGLSISSTIPSVYLHDETDSGEGQLQVDIGSMNLWVRPTDVSAWNRVAGFDLNAPADALQISSTGELLAGGAITAVGRITANGGRITLQGSSQPGVFLDNGSFESLTRLKSGVLETVRVGFLGAPPYSYSIQAPPNSIVVSNDGNLGLGTASPTVDLHVLGNSDITQIRVENTNGTAAPRTLFQLRNKGNTKFGVMNTEAGVEWAFANPGTGFRLSRQGSGVVEMEILNNGNMVISGTLTELSDVNAKTAFTDVDPDQILNLVSEMQVNQWEYKDAEGEKHIGPMAQDFYKAFGLGASENGISTIDTSGVALVAIKALVQENQDLRQRLSQLEAQQVNTQEMVTFLLEAQSANQVVANNELN